MLSAAWLVIVASAGRPAALTGTAADDPKTILDRVYSVAQSDRGESLFKRVCAGCHAATDFAGGMLASHWEAGTLGDIYNVIENYMPANDPGSVKPQEAADIIAFFLHMDGYPVGTDDLPGEPRVLETIGIVPNPK